MAPRAGCTEHLRCGARAGPSGALKAVCARTWGCRAIGGRGGSNPDPGSAQILGWTGSGAGGRGLRHLSPWRRQRRVREADRCPRPPSSQHGRVRGPLGREGGPGGRPSKGSGGNHLLLKAGGTLSGSMGETRCLQVRVTLTPRGHGAMVGTSAVVLTEGAPGIECGGQHPTLSRTAPPRVTCSMSTLRRETLLCDQRRGSRET